MSDDDFKPTVDDEIDAEFIAAQLTGRIVPMIGMPLFRWAVVRPDSTAHAVATPRHAVEIMRVQDTLAKKTLS